MRTCNGCHAAVSDEATTCPQCGNPMARGFLESFFGLFRSKPQSPNAATAPARARERSEPFRMQVEDVFTISGRGTVVTGRIATGEIRMGDDVRFKAKSGVSMESRVIGVEMFRKVVDTAKAGDTVGLLLRGVERQDIEAGTTLENV